MTDRTYDERMLAGERIPIDVLRASCPYCGNGPATADGSPCRFCGDIDEETE